MSGHPAVTEKLVKEVQDQLTCAVCLDFYTDPKVLPCLHVFCQQCLQSIAAFGETDQAASVTCPTCRCPTSLTGANGCLAGLVPAFHIHHLFDIHDALQKAFSSGTSPCDKCRQFVSTAYCRNCAQYICDECANVHKLWGELVGHEVISIEQVRDNAVNMIPLKTAVLRCPKHLHKDLELYCETCGELICQNCTVQQHKTHSYDLVLDAYAARKRAAEANVDPLREYAAQVREALGKIDGKMDSIATQQTALEEDINRTIRRLHDELDLRKKEFLCQLHDLVQDKLKTLAAQRTEAEHTLTQLSDTIAFADGRLRTGPAAEVLTVLKHITTRVDKLRQQYDPQQLEPRQGPNLIFRPGKIQELCKPMTAIFTAPICPSKCLVGEKPTTAVTNQKVAFSVYMKDDCGEVYTGALHNVIAELVSSTARLLCDVKKAKVDGHYVVSCTPTTPKDHEFHVQINGTHIQGSPFALRIMRTIRDITNPIKMIKKLRRPQGVACNSKGELVVVETSFPRVSVHTLHGPKRLRKFGSSGSAPGQFKDPDGVTVDGSDNILVVDSGNHRIQKFTAEGEFVTTVGTKGDGPLQFNLPTNIRIHPQSGNMYVCDQYNHRIQIMKEDFSFVSSFGKEGSEDGDFLYPTDLAFDSIGNVYVCDSKNNRIQILTPNGQYVRKIGDMFGREELEASFVGVSSNIGVYQPSYLHIDPDSNVYITNASNNVAVFKTSGEFVTLFGKQGGGGGEFSSPCGVVVNKEGLLLVSDSNNCRVQVF